VMKKLDIEEDEDKMTMLVETLTPKLEIYEEKGILILFKKINSFISQYGECNLTEDDSDDGSSPSGGKIQTLQSCIQLAGVEKGFNTQPIKFPEGTGTAGEKPKLGGRFSQYNTVF